MAQFVSGNSHGRYRRGVGNALGESKGIFAWIVVISQFALYAGEGDILKTDTWFEMDGGVEAGYIVGVAYLAPLAVSAFYFGLSPEGK